MITAIATVHWRNGFFIFNKGEGIEYTLGVAVMALVLSSLGAGRYSFDQVWKVVKWSPMTSLSVTTAVGVGGALTQLAIFYRPLQKD